MSETAPRPVGSKADFAALLRAVLRDCVHELGVDEVCKIVVAEIRGMGYAKHLRRHT